MVSRVFAMLAAIATLAIAAPAAGDDPPSMFEQHLLNKLAADGCLKHPEWRRELWAKRVEGRRLFDVEVRAPNLLSGGYRRIYPVAEMHVVEGGKKIALHQQRAI